MAVYSVIDLTELKKGERWDAEYFQPDNLRKAELLSRFNPVPINSFAVVTDGIHASPEWVQSDGVRYLSAMCVKDNFITLERVGLISRTQDKFSPRTRARLADVLVTAVGTIGNSAVVEKYILPANKDRHLDIIRVHNPKEVDPYYLATFLNCEFGRFQTVRESTGNVQLNLFIQKLKNVLVPLGRRFEKAEELTRSAYRDLEKARDLYPEAEGELLQRMGWQDLDKHPFEVYYVGNLQTLDTAGRIDAEHFQPRYIRLRRHLQKLKAMSLAEFCVVPHRGVQPEYVAEGNVLVFNSQYIGPTEIDIENAERTSSEFYKRTDVAPARLKRYDVLLYSTGAYVRRTNAFLGDCAAIASNHVTMIRPDPTICHSVYLGLFLNSPPGLSQSIQFATGSAQRELYPQHIQQFLIFLPRAKSGKIDLARQETLAAKIESATRAKTEAREKLEAAKRLVEAAIA